MIAIGTRVYVSSVGEHGKVEQIVKTGIAGIVKYRVSFADDRHRGGVYGEAFCQPVPMPRGRGMLRLAACDGVVLA